MNKKDIDQGFGFQEKPKPPQVYGCIICNTCYWHRYDRNILIKCRIKRYNNMPACERYMRKI